MAEPEKSDKDPSLRSCFVLKIKTLIVTGASAIARGKRWFSRWVTFALSDEITPRHLKSLMPKYDAGEHKHYVKRLLRAVYKDGCLNVALTGSYGSGKSSILTRFIAKARKPLRRVATISLATLKSRITEEDDAQDNLTVRLEREILGQLLYQGKPLKARESSFNRVHKTPLHHRIACALLIAAITLFLLCLILFIADGRKDKLSVWFLFITSHWHMVSTFLIISLIALTIFICCLLYFIPYGLRLGSVSAGGAALTLEKNETSYFNKYRDELLYLFEVNKFDTVVFEDIDRFDDQDIFLELRNLNFTLNNAPCVVKRFMRPRRRVSFVYAIRDSLFESMESEEDTSVVKGSGRTKVFDQIISVVPFASKLSAYDILADIFNEKRGRLFKLSPDERLRFEDLLRLAAPYIADMRLMLSIRNDYLIMIEEMVLPFVESGRAGLEQSLDLRATGILAMAIYKNVYPKEYECLRLGKGSLNALYDAHEETARKMAKAFQEIMNLQKRANSSASDDHADLFEPMGKELVTSILKKAPNTNGIEIKGATYSLETEGERGVGAACFWNVFLSLELTAKVYLVKNDSQGHHSKIEFDRREFIKKYWPKKI